VPLVSGFERMGSPGSRESRDVGVLADAFFRFKPVVR
jgi:hypothetical protein